MLDHGTAVPLEPSPDLCVAMAALPVEPVSPSTTCAEVYEYYRRDPDLITIPVVDHGVALGLVNRFDLTMSLAQDYGRALYASKPITARMDAHPLIVESSTQVEALEWMIAANRPSALTRGFIVTKDGQYVGVGTALTLLQMSMSRSDQRTRELEEARIAAEAADRAKSRFLAVMSHELRTPLNAIIGFAELMKSEIFGPIGSKKYRDYLNDIHSSGSGLLALINDILDLSKISAGKMELFEEAVDLEEEATGAMRVVAEAARSSGILLRIAMPASLPRVFADRRAIRQILLNLLSNAIKFTPKGSVAIEAELRAEGEIVLRAHDTGIGMSPEQIAIALTPFGQVDNDYTRSQKGSGLGMPLIKSLAELHDARFDITSQVGSGTTVSITFPLARVLPPQEPIMIFPEKRMARP